MRSFGKAARVVTLVVAALIVCADVTAQTPTARSRYESANERDQEARALLASAATASPDLDKQIKQVVTSYEVLVRRYPTSGYADNALYQAATLLEAVYARFNRGEDRDRALRFYRWLLKEYPVSGFVKRAGANAAALNEPARVAESPAAPKPAAIPAAAPKGPEPVPADRATLTNIQRSVMPDVVRVTLELDREVRFVEERLKGPERVFFDLQNVRLTPALTDKVLTYTSDVVTKIRVGRHPDNVVRVVLDLEDVARYSVFTLYSPFRLVIDAERPTADRRNAVAILPARPPVATVIAEPVPAPPMLEPLPSTIIASGAPLAKPMTPAPLAVRTAAPEPLQTPPPPPPAALPAPAAPAANGAGGFSIARQLGLSVSRIVIDPGHGGHDPGVLGRGLTEAALVLDIALRLEKLLQKESGVDVVLTRRTDTYVPLEERTEIANRQNADMFLSIHANASRTPEAKGVETYFLSFASSPDAEAVAARENSASTREMHHLTDLVKAITLNNKLDESRDLATMVQESLVSNLRKSNREIRSRGVKKAPFVVLIGAQMPSVLAEISFVSNRQELSLLKTNAYKQKIAEALFAAVMKYRRSLKNQTLTELQ